MKLNKTYHTKQFLHLLSDKLSNKKEYKNDEYKCDIVKYSDRTFIQFSHTAPIFKISKTSKIKDSVLNIIGNAYFKSMRITDSNTISVKDDNLIEGHYIYKQSNKKLVRRWIRMEENENE